jgi:hypothetical protein
MKLLTIFSLVFFSISSMATYTGNCDVPFTETRPRAVKKHIKKCTKVWNCGVGIKEDDSRFSGGDFLSMTLEDGTAASISAQPEVLTHFTTPANNPIFDLDVFLGSEHFGSQYYVKACIQMPELANPAVQLHDITANYEVFSEIIYPSKYAKKAKLNVHDLWNCVSYQGKNIRLVNEGVISKLGNSYYKTINKRYFNKRHILKSCVVKFTFNENSNKSRKQSNNNIRIETDTVLNIDFN